MLQRRIFQGIEVHQGSGNVFDDLGLPDAEELQRKSGLVYEITRAIDKLQLPHRQAAQKLGIPIVRLEAVLRGDFVAPSEEELRAWLNRLR